MEILTILISVLWLGSLSLLVFRRRDTNITPIVEAIHELLHRELKNHQQVTLTALKANQEELTNILNKLTVNNINDDEVSDTLNDFSHAFSKGIKRLSSLQEQNKLKKV